MKISEIKTIVESFGLPCAYYQFEEGTGQAPPFITWFFDNSDDLYADDTNYQRIEVLNIELYTKYKDFDTEVSIEAALNAAGFSFYKETNYIASEKMYQTAYEMEVLIMPEAPELITST